MLTINKDDIVSVDELLLTAEEKANLKLLNIRDGTLISVVDKKKLVGSLVIPDSVTEIGDNAFYDCTGLTNVVIPSTVTVIGEYAFSGCSGLVSVVISDSVTEIKSEAFSGINPDAHFTVKSELVKELLLNSESGIGSEQITIEPNL